MFHSKRSLSFYILNTIFLQFMSIKFEGKFAKFIYHPRPNHSKSSVSTLSKLKVVAYKKQMLVTLPKFHFTELL